MSLSVFNTLDGHSSRIFDRACGCDALITRLHAPPDRYDLFSSDRTQRFQSAQATT